MESRPIDPLTAYCQREGLSQSDLARRLKIPQPTVSKWIRGRRKIDVVNLPRVEKVTGIPASKLRPDLAVLFLPPRLLKRAKLSARAA